MTSTWRAVFDPGGSDELTLVDWGERIAELPKLPWEQGVERPRYAEADFAGVLPFGGVARELAISRRVEYTTHEAMQAALLDHDEAMPAQLTKALHIRVAALPFPDPLPAVGSGDETAATHTHHIAAEASIISAVPEDKAPAMAIVFRYRIALGALVKQP